MKRLRIQILILFFLLMLVNACSSAPAPEIELIQIVIQVEDRLSTVSVLAGSNVSEALDQSGISLDVLDKVEPSAPEILEPDSTIIITRITEEFETETSPVAFTRQIMQSDSHADGEEILLQPGENGLEEITYRSLFENGILLERSIVTRVTLLDPVPEIVLVGIQTGTMPVSFEGVIAYIQAGNAWIIRGSSHQKEPIAPTGDLDSRVFTLSPDGRWLLCSRSGPQDSDTLINTLWLFSTTQPDAEPIQLDIQNVIHFADWSPSTGITGYRIAYSTVEPRASSPGWQANNDLRVLSLTSTGRPLQTEIVLEENPGGQYGWWGTTFAWAPNGTHFAFSRPDAVGLVHPQEPGYQILLETIPYETRSDYIWAPEIAWAADSQVLLVNTGDADPNSSHDSESFRLLAINTVSRSVSSLLDQSSQFVYPSGAASQGFFLLVPVDPTRPLNTHSRLAWIDQDGSNLTVLHPSEDEQGLSAYPIHPSLSGDSVIFMQQQNLWIHFVESGDTHQLTVGGQISAADWK